MKLERSFAPDAASVPAARQFVLDHLERLPSDQRDCVGVIVSELATNAVIHARTEFDVSLELGTDSLRVEMSDGGGTIPRLAEFPPANQLHGRGLLIVDQLVDEWGVTTPPAGEKKTVWFEYSC